MFFLVTGEAPFRGSVAGVVHQVATVDAPPPRLWNASLPKDLETIILRCLEKAPSDRFQTMGEFSDELLRFREGKPLVSRPVSTTGRIWRWAQRNRQAATLIFFVAFLLSVIAIGSTGIAIHLAKLNVREKILRSDAQSAKTVAVENEKLARRESEISRDTVALFESLFVSADPVSSLLAGDPSNLQKTNHGHVTLRELLRDAAERLPSELPNQPMLRARIMDSVGNACRGNGMFNEATRLFHEAELSRTIAIGESNSRESNPAILARHHLYRGQLAYDLSHYEKSKREYDISLSRLESNDRESQLLRAEVLFHLGQVLHKTVKHPDCTQAFAESLTIRKRWLPKDHLLVQASQAGMIFTKIDAGDPIAVADILAIFPDSDDVTGLVRGYLDIQLLRASRDFQGAADAYVEFCTNLNEAISPQHPIAILAAGDCAGALLDAGDYERAYKIGQDAIERGRKLAPNHNMLRLALIRMGDELLRAGRLSAARDCFEEAATIRKNNNPPDPRVSFDTLHGLVWTNFALNELEEAERLSKKLIERSTGNASEVVAWAHYSRARVLDRLGHDIEAERSDKEAIRIARNIRTLHEDPRWMERLAVILNHNGEFNRAEKILSQAIAAELSQRPPDHPQIADRQMSLIRTWIHLGKIDEARHLAEIVLATRIAKLPADDPRIREAEDVAAGK